MIVQLFFSPLDGDWDSNWGGRISVWNGRLCFNEYVCRHARQCLRTV